MVIFAAKRRNFRASIATDQAFGLKYLQPLFGISDTRARILSLVDKALDKSNVISPQKHDKKAADRGRPQYRPIDCGTLPWAGALIG